MASNLTVTTELMALMRWVLKHKKSHMRSLIRASMEEGLRQHLSSPEHHTKHVSSDDLHETVDEFFALLEDEIIDDLADYHIKNAETFQYAEPTQESVSSDEVYKSLSPKIRAQLRTLGGDDAQHIVSDSINQAAQQLSRGATEKSEADHAVMRALLDNWSPEDSNEVN